MDELKLFSRTEPVVPVRAVHLDLKGLPPTAERLLSLLELLARLRFNAALVEWEDMFPWTVDPRFRCETAYTPDQVRRFLDKARSLGIEVIPLVQCLGHMETFLRADDYAPLREVPDLCDVINPLHPGARPLVERLVDDVLALMPAVRHFHLGGDEAWTFGTHPSTRAYIERHGKGALYLHHVQPLLDRLNAKGIRPILWHDMMIEWDDGSLRRLAGYADLCVWGYRETPDETTGHYATRHIRRFHEAGVTLWGATAYKGADGQNIDLPDRSRREHNALGWASVAQRFPLRGLIATAWSRYNTNQQQCEPIDGALDALALVAAILHDGAAPADGIESCLAGLTAAGEHERFDRCRSVLQLLASLRKRGWHAVQDLRELSTMARLDPRRTGSGQQAKALARLRAIVQEADAVAIDLSAAFSGLIEPIWIRRYVAERIEPLRDELAALQ